MKYESPTYNGSWVMARVEIFAHADTNMITIALQTYVEVR